MLFHDFPDLTWLKKQTEERFSNRNAYDGTSLTHAGWPTVILNVNTNQIYRDNIRGPFSFFSNLSGISTVTVEGKRASIDNDYFFLTNADQRYTLEVDKNKRAETFNIHFGEKWIEGISTTLLEKNEKQLDHPDHISKTPFHFVNKLYRKDIIIHRLQQQLLQAQDHLQKEEVLYQLVTRLLSEQHKLRTLHESLTSLKSSTREEIMRRLFEATDYIHSSYHKPISLEDLSKVSCLSRFHFLRLFKQVFGQTPNQFITGLRIEKAKELLNKNIEVKAISSYLGFDNASSFSRLFHQKTGLYPTQFAKK